MTLEEAILFLKETRESVRELMGEYNSMMLPRLETPQRELLNRLDKALVEHNKRFAPRTMDVHRIDLHDIDVVIEINEYAEDSWRWTAWYVGEGNRSNRSNVERGEATSYVEAKRQAMRAANQVLRDDVDPTQSPLVLYATTDATEINKASDIKEQA